MSRGAHNLKQGDVTRAIKGAVNAGLAVKRVEVEGRKIIIFAGRPDEAPNDWDDVR
jgi:hypothetical protein